MAQKHFYSPKAEKDLNAIAGYILEQDPEAALHFVDTVEKTCKQLAEVPGMGRAFLVAHAELQDMRMMRVGKPFHAYLIFYREGQSCIEVLRIIHGARDYPHLF